MNDNMIDIGGGVQLQVGQAGEGDPLILVCGTCQDYRMWSPLMPELTKAYRVTTYNHRGIGDSTRGTGCVSTASLADDLDALMTALDIERAHVLGWSLGSAVAQKLALAYGERVASLTLVATWGRTDAYQAALGTGLSHPWRTGDRNAALTALSLVFSHELLGSGEFAQFLAPFEPLFPSTQQQMATAAEQWDAAMAHEALDRLGAISTPALILAGEQDLLTPARLGYSVADAIPGACYALLTGPGSSHAMFLERAEEFTSLVIQFLGHHSLAGASCQPRPPDQSNETPKPGY
ncbi:alpha/beta fold hydrolase [Mycobacterium sp. E796]|uniref:alpha/beta fold hydrolase n=1 Tax=Mycobacterium sp. E796 TaxID=1834151 RepID=UPI001E49F456|nr:alpha/beta hydrolase [Mycobacterium sp. E796]